MKLGVISGDGLPVSGLLTVLRNVVDLPLAQQLISRPISADFGYSWRPDKPGFYPHGGNTHHPDWLTVSKIAPVNFPGLADELESLRNDVIEIESLSDFDKEQLELRITKLSEPYYRYFLSWFKENDFDWVIAINMTLSDAVSVTRALHEAASEYWSARVGGILFWDHDLFRSYSVHEKNKRVYPDAPNKYTPVPGTHPSHMWAVVSKDLAKETAHYDTRLEPAIVDNILPVLYTGQTLENHEQFLLQNNLEPGRQLILVPVRIFPVKGIDISLKLFAAVCQASVRRGKKLPYLLIFGSLSEDPAYSSEMMQLAEAEGVLENVRFLDGVPLSSYCAPDGRWHFDEKDLLFVAKMRGGAVFFTPNRPDVESVGLGPALAALAELPFAYTPYHAFEEVYGTAFKGVCVNPDDISFSGEHILDWLIGCQRKDDNYTKYLEVNRQIVAENFQ